MDLSKIFLKDACPDACRGSGGYGGYHDAGACSGRR